MKHFPHPSNLKSPLGALRRFACEEISNLLLLLLLASCQKDLCYNHPHGTDNNHGRLHVVFDWTETQSPTATEMHLVAFAGGENAVTYPLTGMAGGDVSLWQGRYWFVAYNSDTETTTTRGNTYDDFEICGVERTVRGTDSLTFIWEPERVWVSTAQDFPVIANTEQTLPMKMWPATYQYTFLIRNVANLDRVSSISATLSGLASGYIPSERRPKDYTVAEIFTFHKVDSTSIRGTLRVFGHSPEEDSETPVNPTDPSGPSQVRANSLTIYVTTDVGNQYGFEYDVTDDMQHPESSSVDIQTGEIIIDIQIEDIPIPDQPPKPTNPTGSFNISIDDFITEEWDMFPK